MAGLGSLAIALVVGFLPLAIEKLRARRSARPIQVVASPHTETGAVPGRACRIADSTGTRFLSDARLIAAATDSAWQSMRAELQVPHVDSAGVVLVSDDPVCRRVVSAFNTTLPESWATSPPTSLYVTRVGNIYIAMVPAPPDGSVGVYAVVDDRYDVLSKFAK